MNISIKRLSPLLVLILAACTMTQQPIGNPEAPYRIDNPSIGDIVHLPTGVKVTAEQMTSAISDARIVYVGETHDNPAAHRLELQVLKAVAERYPGQVSLGMEMFNNSQQDVLDQWVAGELTEKEFLKTSDWYRVWAQDYAYYRDILDYAREQRIPVVGLNVTQEFRRKVGMNALSELDEETRVLLPDMDLDDPYQTAMTEAIFAEHSRGQNMLDGFQRIQTLWDEAMAESVATHLAAQGSDHRMVVMAGGNHIRYGFGIPRRVYRRLPTSYVMVGVRELVIPAEKKGLLDTEGKIMDVDMPTFPMVPYDYLVLTEYESLPGERVKLGVRMKEEDGQVIIEAVVPHSAADKAGLEEGDIIVALDEVEIRENFDLIYAIKQYFIGDQARVTIKRDGEPFEMDVTFIPLPVTPSGHGTRTRHKP